MKAGRSTRGLVITFEDSDLFELVRYEEGIDLFISYALAKRLLEELEREPI